MDISVYHRDVFGVELLKDGEHWRYAASSEHRRSNSCSTSAVIEEV